MIIGEFAASASLCHRHDEPERVVRSHNCLPRQLVFVQPQAAVAFSVDRLLMTSVILVLT